MLVVYVLYYVVLTTLYWSRVICKLFEITYITSHRVCMYFLLVILDEN